MVVGGAQSQPDGKDHRTAAEVQRDGGITNTINSKYVKDPKINAMDIHVSSYQGTVILRGHVHGEFDAQRAVQIAKDVAGVHKVVSRLQIGH